MIYANLSFERQPEGECSCFCRGFNPTNDNLQFDVTYEKSMIIHTKIGNIRLPVAVRVSKTSALKLWETVLLRTEYY